jgi:hypothetical protein
MGITRAATALDLFYAQRIECCPDQDLLERGASTRDPSRRNLSLGSMPNLNSRALNWSCSVIFCGKRGCGRVRIVQNGAVIVYRKWT